MNALLSSLPATFSSLSWELATILSSAFASQSRADPSSPLPGQSSYHTPVLPLQTSQAFSPSSQRKCIVDATAGGGGHSELLLQAGHEVIALDRDQDALEETTRRLASYGKQFRAIHTNFSEIDTALDSLGIQQVDGILADFGVSSHQLDAAARGFSFMREGSLDMRMDQSQTRSAYDILHTYGEEELKTIFREYGEERFSGKLARLIVQQRDQTPFTTTTALADFILKALGKREKIHPATRVFQALRIETNNELGEIKTFLHKATKRLSQGGRLALISFHSLEDRLVKQFINRHSKPTLDRPEWPAPRPNPEYCLTSLTKKPLIATHEESGLNPRSRTAKLRIAEKRPSS